jgi:hypothetical protein
MNTWLTAVDNSMERIERRVVNPYAFAAVTLAIFAIWMVLHPFWGIKHDSILYSWAALARLHPESLTRDVFLSLGSQDQYTIFSPLYAAAIRHLSLEPAAALLTFVFQLAFFGSAWLLARRFMSTRLALLATGLLVVLPSGYGAFQIFQYIEEFLTPRELAEACVLAAVAAAAARRPLLSGIAILLGLLVHPVMAASGVAMLLTLYVAIPRPKLAIAISVAGLVALLAAAVLVPVGPLTRIDDLWWSLLQERSKFLFISLWSLSDWSGAIVPLGVLAIGYRVCKDPFVRKLCLASLLIAGAGLGLTLLGSDFMRILIVTQAQPWRWTWLSSVVAVLVIPLVARDAWGSGSLARASVILMAASWMFRAEASALIVTALAVVAAVASRNSVESRRTRHAYLVSVGVCVIAVLFNLTSKSDATTLNPTFFELPGGGSPGLQRLRLIATDGIVPASLLLLVWWVAFKWKVEVAPRVAAAAALASCVVLAPVAWQSWSAITYTPQLYATYAEWRKLIPPGSQVFWSDDPLGPSYILERASYISTLQTAGMVFSRKAAMEMLDRTKRMKPLFWTGQFDPAEREWAAKHHPRPDLKTACRQSAADFVVWAQDLKEVPLAIATPNKQHPNAHLRLYRCSDFRG